MRPVASINLRNAEFPMTNAVKSTLGAGLRQLVWLIVASLILLISSIGHAADPQASVRTFLNTYCLECHGPEKQKGDRRFDELSLPVTKVDTLIELQDILDQLNLGEMPPKKSKQPAPAETREAVAWLTGIISDGHARLASTGGRTVLRRLNQREYLNTIGDLFALNMAAFDPTTKFPRDQTVEHLDNIGDTLRTSPYLLAQYLDAADVIVEKAFALTHRPPEQAWKFDGNFRQQPELANPHSKVFNYRYLCLYETQNTVNHEGGYGPVHGFEQGVPADGFYEIKVMAQALNRHHPYDLGIFKMDPEEPFRLGIVPGDVKAGPLHHPQPIEPQLAEVTPSDGEPEWYTMRVWLDAGHTPRFTFPNGAANSRQTWVRLLTKYRDTFPESVRKTAGIFDARPVVLKYGKVPHIRIHEVRIRGPLYDQWPPASQQAVLGGQPFADGRTREILEDFASRAFRRPVRAEELERLMQVVAQRRQDGRTEFEAMKDGLKAVLCSPAFLYLAVPEAPVDQAASGGRALDAHALASRLSYFLWSTMPDAELRQLADNGEILKPDVLTAQTRRLLASPRADTFIADFLGSWLNLRSLGDMPPDRDAFEVYYAKDLQAAMKRETQLFMRHLVDHNESIQRFIQADYTFVNEPLARLYGIRRGLPPDRAHEFQKVSLTDPNRGGLLGQGSVLTVSANGIETSPVVRGVWLLENILGTPPAPPPDNVPAIDPDVRGATSMRDILTKHRDNPACFDCHQKIDPLGFALENFDPIGAWRTHYPLGRKTGPVIDAGGQLPGGESFRDIAGLKEILLERKELFGRMLTQRLLAYACGRRMEALDRPQINHIVHELQRDDGLRRLIELVVLSDAFRSK